MADLEVTVDNPDNARALAALDGAKSVQRKHLLGVAPMALRHRLPLVFRVCAAYA